MKRVEDNLDKYKSLYNVPKHKTSAEIISEARAEIHKDLSISRIQSISETLNMMSGGSGGPHPLGTQRPFTPRERQRTLFGKASRISRPPSAVNLKYLKHQCNENLKSTPLLSKKSNSLNNSFDGYYNNHILDNIDETVELGLNKTDEYKKKVVPINDFLGDQVNGSKLKLPSLNGLAKPLHQRKNTPNSSESLDDPLKLIKKPLKLSDDPDYFPSIHNASDVFNKRKLFGLNVSKSDETENKPKEDSRESDCIGNDVEDKNDLALMKFAVRIHSPEPLLHEIKTDKGHSVQNILNHLSNRDPKTDNDVTEMLIMLYNTLDKDNSWQDMKNPEKTSILKVLYSFIESLNEKLLIAIARIILALRVTGSNLSGVCKLIFKIARNDKNDHLFMEDNILDLFMIGLGRAEPLHDAECLVYGYGALKFLGMNQTLLEQMRTLGALPLMTLHLKMFNEARADNPHGVGEQGCHGLYQLTGALRNMAGGDTSWNNDNVSSASTPCNHLLDFLTGGTLGEICRTMTYFTDDLDVEINASRTLSVLSADYECCVNLCEQKGIIPAMIKLLNLYTERSPLVVRLTYILGNMVACNNDTRLDLYEESGSIGILLKILDSYKNIYWPGEKVESAENIIIGSDLDGSNGSNEDVMIKTIRVIANMCMNPTVGSRLAESSGSGEKILGWILKCLHQYSPVESEELTVSTLATLNNLSYYHSGDENDITAFNGFQIHFCEVLCRLFPQKIKSCTTEAIRVLGNMSRSKVTRDYIIDVAALLDITKLTENDDEETALAAAGVLVNMAADENARQVWNEVNGVRIATNALRKASNNHYWQLAQLICQALWNALPLSHSDVSLITPLLLDILDEQQVFGNYYPPFGEMNISSEKLSLDNTFLLSRLAWEEFAGIAINLLEKIDPALDSPQDEYDEDIFAKTRNNMIPI